MSQQIRSFMAIAASLMLGLVVAALPGCQPPAGPTGAPKPPKSAASTTTDAVSDSAAADKKDAPDTVTNPVGTPEADDPDWKTKKVKLDAAKAEAEAKPDPKVTNPVNTPEADAPLDKKPDAKKEEEDKPDAPTSGAGEKKDATQSVSVSADAKTAEVSVPKENPVQAAGDWSQWGGNSIRNNVPTVDAAKVPTEWVPGEFDRDTGKWDKASSKNIKWVATLGSQTYGNTVVAGGRVYLGTNNSAGYLKRYPADVDLGCLVAFSEKDGSFLWQHSSEKLPTGRVHDWPLMGICCSPLVEGDRVYFVTSRGEVKCVDSEGFYDGEDDGPTVGETARLFDVMRGEEAAQDKVAPAIAELDAAKVSDDLRARFAKAGEELPADIKLNVKEAGKSWNFKAKVNDAEKEFRIMLQGPRLSAFKVLTVADKNEADVVWTLDMMKQLGTSQHNMCSCSVTTWGDLLFVNSSNGVHEDHKTIPAPDAPSFICMNKHTGQVYWTDNSPGENILHGQWSSPTVAIIAGVPQVIFGGGDAWVYSFRADTGKDGKGELLWKFDINDKDALLELGGRGTRNDIIATPVVYDDKVYFATGQDPEHGEGKGTFWCIDPTKRGDISESLAVNVADPAKPIPVKRVQAVVEKEGDRAIPNPNSGVVWKLTEQDADGNGKIDDFMEKFHRGIGTCAIKNDLLYVADFSGLFFCINAKTGKLNWTYDMLAASWGSPLIAGDKVFIGDEDGDILVFELKAEQHDPIAEINMGNSVYSSPIMANDVLYIANKDHIFAIAAEEAAAEK